MTDSKEINIILGANIKYIRNKCNITREKLAEKIDVSTRFLSDVEGGKVGVSLTTLKNLSKSLNISTDYLLGISKFDNKNICLNSIENKIKNMDYNMLENLDKIIDCIINIEGKNSWCKTASAI